MPGTPLKNLFPFGVCQARNRRGERCKVRLEVFRCRNGRWLCRWHGGLSSGAKTPQGKERSLKALKDGWRRWRERVKKQSS